MGVTKDATAQIVKMEQDGPAALHQVPFPHRPSTEHCWACICTWTFCTRQQGMTCTGACRRKTRAWEQGSPSKTQCWACRDFLYHTTDSEIHKSLQGGGKGMGAGKGKRVMGGGGPMSQTAQQAELKLEQMVDQRDMAVAKASVNGDAAVEPVINQEILPISEVCCPILLRRHCLIPLADNYHTNLLCPGLFYLKRYKGSAASCVHPYLVKFACLREPRRRLRQHLLDNEVMAALSLSGEASAGVRDKGGLQVAGWRVPSGARH